jgi:hypothetical protein
LFREGALLVSQTTEAMGSPSVGGGFSQMCDSAALPSLYDG